MEAPPDEFIQDYEKWREHWDWAERRIQDEGDAATTRLVIAETGEFVERWQHKIDNAVVGEVLHLARSIIANLQDAAAALYKGNMRDLLEARRRWLLAKLFTDAAVSFIDVMQNAPDTLRPGLEQIFRDHMGYEFDAERFYREDEASLDEKEQAYQKKLRQMEVDWPEDMTADLMARLNQADVEEVQRWSTELAAEIDQLKEKTARQLALETAKTRSNAS